MRRPRRHARVRFISSAATLVSYRECLEARENLPEAGFSYDIAFLGAARGSLRGCEKNVVGQD